MLDRLLRSATGYSSRPVARCTACDASYSRAKPFIEGPDGILICHGCVTRLKREASPRGPSGDDCSTSPAIRQAALTDQKNPYAPPSHMPDMEDTCALCGLPKEIYQLYPINSTRVVCHGCITASLAILNLEKGKHK